MILGEEYRVKDDITKMDLRLTERIGYVQGYEPQKNKIIENLRYQNSYTKLVIYRVQKDPPSRTYAVYRHPQTRFLEWRQVKGMVKIEWKEARSEAYLIEYLPLRQNIHKSSDQNTKFIDGQGRFNILLNSTHLPLTS